MEKATVKRTAAPLVIPALAMRGLVLFPRMVLHFDVGRKKSIAALNAAMENGRKIFLITQKDAEVEEPGFKDLYTVGVVAQIQQLLRVSGDTVRVLVEGEYKARLKELTVTEPYLEAVVTKIPPSRKVIDPIRSEALVRSVKQVFEYYCDMVPKMPKETIDMIFAEEDPYSLFDQVVQNVILRHEAKQYILEQRDILSGLQALAEELGREAEVLRSERDVLEQVKEQMDKNQRDYFLREQMRVISEQLGEGDNTQDEAMEFADQIQAIQRIPDDSREKLMKECERLYKMPPNSQEANVIRNYLETCLELPWDKETKDKLDLDRAKKILDRDHYGLEKVKERILESLAVRKLSPDIKGQIICLVGPPGVGKTSIAKAVAAAMGRNYVRLSLGGIKDESDIRGHRKTYIGAMPGRIITALKQAKSRNPLMLLDEIDKMGSDFRGDPSSAMLEVLDSEQNYAFRDHYIEIPFDLSDVLFLTTANTLDTIPAPLLDRMEVIELSSYTREEKFQIAKRHLVKKQVHKHGLTGKNFRIANDALYMLIDNYTREAGVRKLERSIATLCRKAAKVVAQDENAKVSITAKNLPDFLGPKKFLPERILSSDQVGVVTGLAWTMVGGETMQIEVSVLEGSGRLELTGSLGDVMKESARTAVSFVRSLAPQYGIDKDFYKTKDIHIHVPEGAVPKDGPSAGITLVTALVSALSGIPVKRDVAMTGEVTLRGRVLAIGGLKEKSMAAYRAGVKTVIIPQENKADLAQFDPVVTDAITFLPVEHVTQVLKYALRMPAANKQEQEPEGEDLPLPPAPPKENTAAAVPS